MILSYVTRSFLSLLSDSTSISLCGNVVDKAIFDTLTLYCWNSRPLKVSFRANTWEGNIAELGKYRDWGVFRDPTLVCNGYR